VEEEFAKPDRACEVLEKILLIDDRNQKAYAISSGCTSKSASGRRWSTLPQAHHRDQRRQGPHRALFEDGHVYEAELRDLERAIDAYQDVLNVETDHLDALAGLARLYEETEQWDRAVEMMRRLLRVSADPKQKVDLNYRSARSSKSR